MTAGSSSPSQYRQRDFESQVRLFKQLAQSAWVPPASGKRDADAKSMARFRGLEGMIARSAASIQAGDADTPARQERMASLAICMYLFDKTCELHGAVAKQDRVGLYSLFDSLRDSVYQLISERSSGPLADVVASYLEHEPRLAACADLAGVGVVSVQEATALYEPKVKRLMQGKKDR
jgi:hypothetical protein